MRCVLGQPLTAGTVEQAGFSCAAYQHAPDIDAAASQASKFKDWAVDPGTAFTALCDHLWFGPAAHFAADVSAEIERFDPHALAIDYFLYAALAAAERARIPAAVLWHTTFGEWDVLNQGLPTSMELPANAFHVGPQVPLEPPGAGMAGTRQGPLVLASLSTSYQAQEGLLRRLVAALGDLPVRGVVTTGPAVALNGDRPANVDVTAWIPHTDVLPHASLVITHAGLGTVNMAMAHGVPMLCLPMGRDQHGNAARVEHLGLGYVLPADVSASGIAAVIRKALADPALHRNAARHAERVRARLAGDPAVTHLEALLGPQPSMNARTSRAV
jgi:UDP-glucoronosyl and UDP-glucosyl transferase